MPPDVSAGDNETIMLMYDEVRKTMFTFLAPLIGIRATNNMLTKTVEKARAAYPVLLRSAPPEHLESLARRVYELVGWHVELYVDSRDLEELKSTLVGLPAVSIDHLGLAREGLASLLELVEKGVKVKATGFGRVDFDVATVIEQIVFINPESLMFGTDLPSTRAPAPYRDADYRLVVDLLDPELVEQVMVRNALGFYRPQAR
jgi:predicted TIM-barrel fold metal-dependent hydrolase